MRTGLALLLVVQLDSLVRELHGTSHRGNAGVCDRHRS
jgi:hypothetical protein